MIKDKIINHLQIILKDLGLSELVPQLEIPTDLSHGDYTTNIAFIAYRRLAVALDSHVDELIWVNKSTDHGAWKSPFDFAKQIAEDFGKKLIDGIEKVEVIQPGFINFWVSKKTLVKNMSSIKDID